MYPSGHSQWYFPWSLMQWPTPHICGCKAHSFTSNGSKEEKNYMWQDTSLILIDEINRSIRSPMQLLLVSSKIKPSLQEHMKLPNVLVQCPFWQIFSYSSHSLISSRITVSWFGLYPEPPGHNSWNSFVPTWGHSSQRFPQALPMLQQHVAFVTEDAMSKMHWGFPVPCSKPTKQNDSRLSVMQTI